MGKHALPRNAARAITQAGGPFAQLLKGGHWRSWAYRVYLDIGQEDAHAVASIRLEASEDQAAGAALTRIERPDAAARTAENVQDDVEV